MTPAERLGLVALLRFVATSQHDWNREAAEDCRRCYEGLMSGAARYDTPKTESYVVRQVGFAWCVDRLTEWSENGRWIETRAQVAEFKNHDLAIHSAREFAERLNRGSR